MRSSRSGTGGKIVTYRRRQRLATTPYDRPPPQLSSPLPQKSPNWFKAVIVPSARAIASGAGKILSSIFSESDSSSSDGEDYASEDDVDNDVNPYDGVGVGKSEKESLLAMRRAGTKKLIEQLIMQETFSREECDKLIHALNSRVTGCSREEVEKSLLADFPETLTDHDADIYDKAVEEARKWFQEKKVGSSKATECAHGSPTLRFNGLEQVDSGGGSPVDVARSYMKHRLPWSSPTSFELRTPRTTIKPFNERTLYSVGPDSFSSSKKRNFLSSGSWNIQEEMRRVRSKAIDDLLRTPSSKVDPALLSASQSWRESVEAAKVVSAIGEQVTQPESFRRTEAVDQMIDIGVSYGSAPAVWGTRQDGKAGEALSSWPATSIHANNENLEALPYDAKFSASKSLEEHHTDPHSNKTNGPPPTEVTESVVKPGINGLPSSEASFPGVAVTSGLHDEQHNMEKHDMENHDAELHEMGNHDADTINETIYGNANQSEDICKQLGAYMEVPVVAETDSVTSSSQNSVTVQNREWPRNLSQPSPKAKGTEQHQRRKSERYSQKKWRKR